MGVNETAQQILKGEAHQLPLSADQMKFMECLETPTRVRESEQISRWITPKQWKSCWNAQKEDTSAGPSGLHFGQFKANAKDDDMCLIDSTLASIPFATGYNPKRWSRGTNVMLYKKVANNHVEKLRTILLYEADFNALNKILGKAMLENGERCGSIACEQYGSRKNKSATIQCLNKRLTFDLWRQNKTPGAILSNDAKSCYDRILHNIASMAMQRQGVHPSNIICMFTTIQNLTHTVRTAFGDSKKSFHQNIWAAPLHGVGQGNGAGPAIWAVVSSPILDLLRKEGIGAAFKMNLTGKVVKVLGYSFVDDTDLVVGGNCDYHDDITSEMQRALDLWQTGIEATGGALVPEKSFWSEVSFEWDETGQWNYCNNITPNSKIIMKDMTNEEKTLKKIQPDEAIETLGVHLTTNGSDDIQFQVLRSKAVDWANKVKKGGMLSRNDAWICLQSTILRSLEYPLPVTCLTREQCTKIMTPVLDVALPGVGISRRFLHSYIHAPPECFGMDIPSLFTYQGSSHIDMLISHWNDGSTTADLLRSSIESLQIETGIQDNPLNSNFHIWKDTITPCWMTSTWEFMSQYKITVELDLETIPLRRENDHYIMEQFIAAGATKSQLKVLNRCRLFLKVISWADICDASGQTIVEQAWIGKELAESRSNLSWPIQGIPNSKGWTLWRSFLRKSLKLINKRLHSTFYLGQWKEHPTEQSWKWFADLETRTVYQKYGPIVTLFKGRSIIYHNKQYIRHSMRRILPQTAIRCTVKMLSRNKIKLLSVGSSRIETQSLQKKTYLPIEMEINQDAQDDIIRGLQTGSVIAVSDGSFKSEFGTGAFIVYNCDSGKYIRGCAVSYGGQMDQSAYRSELIGLSAIITYVTTLVKSNAITNASIEVACDGISALNNIFDRWKSKTKTNMKHYDVISYARNLISQSSIKWSSRHVYGHREDITTELTIWEQLNVKVDDLASKYWLQQQNQYRYKLKLSDGLPNVSIEGIAVCSKLRKSIQQRTNYADWLLWWRRKQLKDGKQCHNLDWKSMKLAFSKISHSLKRWVMKHNHGTCGVNYWLHRWKQHPTPTCERCNETNETSLHIWKCPNATAWTSIITKWESWLHRFNCPENDIKAYISIWQSWRRDIALTMLNTTVSTEMSAAIIDQNNIGWDRFAFGYVSNKWKIVLSSWTGNRYSPSVQSLIKTIWEAGYKLWDERNEWVHNDKDIKQAKKINEINRMIMNEYRSGTTHLPIEEQELLRRPILETLSSTRSVKKNWLGRMYAARASVRRRLGILSGEEVEDSYKNERRFLHNWRSSGSRKKENDTKQQTKGGRTRKREELLLRVKKRRKQILYGKSRKND